MEYEVQVAEYRKDDMEEVMINVEKRMKVEPIRGRR
jgi:hypothetical protein